MEYSVTKELLALNETLFEGCQEQPIDLDFSLPDYCPDIQKILKCCIVPKIHSKNISADRLDVDGVASVKLLYIDSVRMCVRCCENSVPFSSSFNLGDVSQNAVVLTKTKVEYVNCRALSPRRLDIHGAFSVCVKVLSKEMREVGSYVDSDDIMQKQDIVEVSNVVGIGQQQFTQEEKLDLDKPDVRVESILRSSINVTTDECKVVSNKVIVKGQATVRVLYISDIDSCDMQTIEYTLPINQIVDVDSAEEGNVCESKLELLSYDININQEMDEESSFVLDMRLVATTVVYEQSEVKVLADAYSNTYDTDMTSQQIKLPKYMTSVNDTHVDKSAFELSDKGVSSVIDIWSDVASVTATPNEDGIEFKGKFNICVLAKDNEDETFYSERVVDFTHEHKLPESIPNILCDADIDVSSVNYRINGDNLEVRSEVKLSCPVYQMNHYKSIDSIFANEEKPRQRDTSSALVVYYADEGENVWDIARKYCTSMDLINDENDLTEEVLSEPRMLLIPMTR